MTAVYYDARSAQVYTLNAAYNTVGNETEALTIPRHEPSGRTALVPGFMAGAQALHDRFGKLPLEVVLRPAIWIAEEGVSFSPTLDAWVQSSRETLSRLPETKRVFTNDHGGFLRPGEVFRQPELAATLKRLAAQGAGYMYRGDWAQHFVAALQREGGRMTLEDLAKYRAEWTEPLRVKYGDADIFSLGPPNLGGQVSLGSLKLAEAAGLRKAEAYTASPRSLFEPIEILRLELWYAFLPADQRSQLFPGLDPALSQVSPEISARLLERIRSAEKANTSAPILPSHSAGILVVDDAGNVASVLHSINTSLWGSSGLFVDGISIPDSAAFQQQQIAAAGPGRRLPETTNPLLVLRNGKPILASVAVGNGLQQVTVQNLLNILDHGLDAAASIQQPNTHGPYIERLEAGNPVPVEGDEVVDGEFSFLLLDKMRALGQSLHVRTDSRLNGYWAGLQIDPVSHRLIGAASPRLPSFAEGY